MKEINNGLKPCPFCGAEVELYGGPENWRPTWYDPDSGGDPYYINCKCGCVFDIGSHDGKEFEDAWNKRAEKTHIIHKMQTMIKEECIAGGIYPAFVARVVENVGKKLLEDTE